jgi:pimeloyl-ACP methyl ester carboxylesterase
VPPLPHVDGVTHRCIGANGVRIHVAEAGAGPPLILLHGWPQHWYQWRHVIGPLAARHRVICPDLRGQGWSSVPDSGYDKETMAGDVIALLDALRIERAGLIGHDWGGWIGFLACLRAPERFERYLALNIPHPFQRLDRTTLAYVPRTWYQAVIQLGGRRLMPAFARWGLRHGGVRDRGTFTNAELDAFADVQRDPRRAWASRQLYRTFALKEVLPATRDRYRKARLRTPTLIVFGTSDLYIPHSLLRGAAGHADDLRIELVRGCGHFIADERPDLVADRALAFFGSQ